MKITYKKVNIGYPCYSVFLDGLYRGSVLLESDNIWSFYDYEGFLRGSGRTRKLAVKEYVNKVYGTD